MHLNSLPRRDFGHGRAKEIKYSHFDGPNVEARRMTLIYGGQQTFRNATFFIGYLRPRFPRVFLVELVISMRSFVGQKA